MSAGADVINDFEKGKKRGFYALFWFQEKREIAKSLTRIEERKKGKKNKALIASRQGDNRITRKGKGEVSFPLSVWG